MRRKKTSAAQGAYSPEYQKYLDVKKQKAEEEAKM